MNEDLKNLIQWLKANKLSLNIKKTELKTLNYTMTSNLNSMGEG